MELATARSRRERAGGRSGPAGRQGRAGRMTYGAVGGGTGLAWDGGRALEGRVSVVCVRAAGTEALGVRCSAGRKKKRAIVFWSIGKGQRHH